MYDYEGSVGAVFLRDRRGRDVDAGQIDALVTLDFTRVDDARDDTRRFHVQHNELDETVVHEDAISYMHVRRKRLVRDRHLVAARNILGTEHDIGPVLEVARRSQVTDADARSLKVSEDRDRSATPSSKVTNDRDRTHVLFVRPVREVDASDVEPCVNETVDRIGRGGRRAKRADDLRARVVVRGHG